MSDNCDQPVTWVYALSMYTIHRDETGTTFNCSQCTYSVVVHQGNGKTPSPRTFAASLLHKHAEEEHKNISASVVLDGEVGVPEKFTNSEGSDYKRRSRLPSHSRAQQHPQMSRSSARRSGSE